MSSTLVIKDTVAWMPKSRTFEKALREIAAVLDSQDSQLQEFLLVREDEYFLDLSDLSQPQFDRVARAVCDVLEMNISTDSDSESVWYCKALILLKVIMNYYSSEGHVRASKNLIITRDVVWQAPKLFFEMTLEELAFFTSSQKLRNILLPARHDIELADLSILDEIMFCKFAAATEEFSGRFGSCMGRGTSDHQLFEEFCPYVKSLHEIILTDSRLATCED